MTRNRALAGVLPGPARFLAEDFNMQLFEDLSGAEAAKKVTDGEVEVLDVRYEIEYHDHRIPEATLIPLPQLYTRFHELDPQKPILVVCEHGLRSRMPAISWVIRDSRSYTTWQAE